jgi:NADH dehydrogenase/NADH:ubiquinone oxidoreductase subunit G
LILVSDTPVHLTGQASQFIHINRGSLDAFVLAFADKADNTILEKLGASQDEIDEMLKTIGETQGDLIIMFGPRMSPEARAALTNAAGGFATENRRVLLHPLPFYSNSVGANDMSVGKKSVADVLKNSKSLYIAGSLLPEQLDENLLRSKDFIVVQELFETMTTDFADVVFPAASFAEVDGTYTNNGGLVQRVRQSIEPVNQAKADWIIASLIAREMDIDFGYNFSASAVFRSLADATPAYAGLRYPNLKDETRPVQVKHTVVEKGNLTNEINTLRQHVEAMPVNTGKITEAPHIGYKLHQVHTLTGKTAQFHLLEAGNPKPANTFVSPLLQFNLDGTPRVDEQQMAKAVSVGDRLDDKESVHEKVVLK